jgi:hypothetical protein
MTLEASNWAQNMQEDVLYSLESQQFCVRIQQWQDLRFSAQANFFFTF